MRCVLAVTLRNDCAREDWMVSTLSASRAWVLSRSWSRSSQPAAARDL